MTGKTGADVVTTLADVGGYSVRPRKGSVPEKAPPSPKRLPEKAPRKGSVPEKARPRKGLEIGPRCCLPADSRKAAVKPQ